MAWIYSIQREDIQVEWSLKGDSEEIQLCFRNKNRTNNYTKGVLATSSVWFRSLDAHLGRRFVNWMLKITLNACNPIYLRAMNHKELSISKILICATLSLYLLRLMPVSLTRIGLGYGLWKVGEVRVPFCRLQLLYVSHWRSDDVIPDSLPGRGYMFNATNQH